jgi:16S rRNA (uracil1498-N3)-methyltransferase
MPHFFINSKNIQNNTIIINDKENYTHIAKSLRAKTGEKILLLDENQIQYKCEIKNITSTDIKVKIIKSYKSERELKFQLYLAQTPLRSEAQNLVIEKATELGVIGIYPVFTNNCSLKKSVIEQKIPKWQKIMLEASKQCERATIPTCFKMYKMQELIVNEKFDKILAFAERNADFNSKKYFRNNPIKEKEKILVIIGPEGGFSKDEFEFFKNNNIITLSLGDLILKAETAVVVGLGNIIYEYE